MRLCLAVWLSVCALSAEDVVVAPDGRFVLPPAVAAVEIRVASAAPVVAAERTLKLPGLLAPALQWRTAEGAAVRLDLCRVQRPAGLSEVTLLAARVRLTNPTALPQRLTLAVALLPEREVRALSFERHAFFIEGQPVLVADTPSAGAILAESPLAPRPFAPRDIAAVTSAAGQCRGEMFFDVALAAGQTQSFGWVCPSVAAVDLEFCRALVVTDLFAQAEREISAAR